MAAGPRRRSTLCTRSSARELDPRGPARLLTEIELPLVASWPDGAGRDRRRHRTACRAARSNFAAQVARPPPKAAYAVIGREINLGSPKQLQVVLFDELGMPKTKKTKTGYTTDAEALQSLFAKTEHPFLRAPAGPPGRHPAAVDRRRAAQVGRRRRPDPHHLSTRHRGHRPAVQHRPEPAEHPDPHRRRAAGSGRRSSSATATTCLLTADYSQIEMRIMAHLSKDEGLIEAFRSGEDLHRFVGVPGVRRADRRGRRRRCAAGSRRCPTAWRTG